MRLDFLVRLLPCCLLLAWPLELSAAAHPAGAESRPKVGLVLSGGGAKGLAHVGVLRVLEEIRVPVDYIAGTSAGSAVAALYALGMPVDEIEQRFINMNWLASFQDTPGRSYLPVRRKQQDWRFPVTPGIGVRADGVHVGRGLISGQNLGFTLNELTREAALVRDFDQLPIPYRAVATDLETGEEVVIGEGSLADAIRASMSIPAVYAPFVRDGRPLVDGGIANNMPISVVKAMGADVVIAVDISDALAAGDSLTEAFSVVGQLTTLLTRDNVLEQLALLSEDDVLISPDLEGLSSADFFAAPMLIEIGATAARHHAVELYPLSVDAGTWQDYLTRRAERPFMAGPITEIRVQPSARISETFVLSRIRQPLNQPLDVPTLDEDLKRLYGLGYHETVNYSLLPAETGTVLEVQAREKSWGPNYLSFGLGYEESFNDDASFNVSAAVRMTELNRLGGEWLTGIQIGTEPYVRSEWFQPLGFGFEQFAVLGAEYEKEEFDIFDNGTRIVEADVKRRQLDLALGANLTSNTEARVGLHRGFSTLDELVSRALGSGRRRHRGGWDLQLVHDSLDDPLLPGDGAFIGLKGKFERPALGADADYDRVTLLASGAAPWENYRFLGTLYVDVVTDGEADIDDFVILGGFRQLTAYGHGEIAGPDAALASVFGYRAFGGPFVPFYAGAGVEVGNAWQSVDQARWAQLLRSYSLFAGIDTFLGPVQITAAYNDDHRWSAYLNIGYYLGRLFD
ncbi:patatin-like phospholipase family protein [Marinobacter sp. SS21]|uniref:patatin-like phospholipase family protein n=1 Tax=Marinobacter sp. SS21 TaxID=2979460 RepID=UPI002330DA49|nr:patatin-like phospholipase family protein [Marinobacter sp. SS21]MDC0661341.1 patatin-like phospholipase family protein [Marinobacter sp. SS21]